MIPSESCLGSEMLIACWHCGLCLMPFKIQGGTHPLTCSRCKRITQVKVYLRGAAWRLETGPRT